LAVANGERHLPAKRRTQAIRGAVAATISETEGPRRRSASLSHGR
jgi:hypothetical protein